MTIIECDGGCGARSPDAKGLHVANNWLRVRAQPNGVFRRADMDQNDQLFCPKCSERVLNALGIRVV